MYIHEYGDSTAPVIAALHPMGIAGEDLFRTLRPYLKGNYCLVVPDQGGHGRSGPYISLQDETDTLKNYLLYRGYTEIRLLYGASMGVTVAWELLKDPAFHFEKVWLDGAGFTENPPPGAGLIGRLLRIGLVIYRKFPRHIERSFAKHYGPVFAPIMMRNFRKLSDEDIEKVFGAFSCRETGEIPRNLQRRMHLEWGEFDANYRNSRKTVKKRLPEAKALLRAGYGHCGYMAFHTEEYVQELETFMQT